MHITAEGEDGEEKSKLCPRNALMGRVPSTLGVRGRGAGVREMGSEWRDSSRRIGSAQLRAQAT